MLGAVILFLGWELRKKQREIQKLDLEIAQLRSQQSLVRVATIHEMNSLIKDVEEISARKLGILGGTSPREDFGIRFRESLVLTSARLLTAGSCESGGVSQRSVAFCRSSGARKRGVTFRMEREAVRMFWRGFPFVFCLAVSADHRR